jgi:hypothetical protein
LNLLSDAAFELENMGSRSIDGLAAARAREPKGSRKPAMALEHSKQPLKGMPTIKQSGRVQNSRGFPPYVLQGVGLAR